MTGFSSAFSDDLPAFFFLDGAASATSVDLPLVFLPEPVANSVFLPFFVGGASVASSEIFFFVFDDFASASSAFLPVFIGAFSPSPFLPLWEEAVSAVSVFLLFLLRPASAVSFALDFLATGASSLSSAFAVSFDLADLLALEDLTSVASLFLLLVDFTSSSVSVVLPLFLPACVSAAFFTGALLVAAFFLALVWADAGSRAAFAGVDTMSANASAVRLSRVRVDVKTASLVTKTDATRPEV
ncbi:hypothetical protein [Asticcacaulis sp. AC466]|uniref:hypothetical protein n=1 Tax=Asticcacaulis sp. AC466 TaxID=1282362 RepID=UPI001F379F14|nr:hypothetical protein [Asticcacaulis sp. AC466]